MPYDARAIANFVLDEADELHLKVTNMAINKILYFCHGWYLAHNGRPLLLSSFEAWDHGPVIPLIYRSFKINNDKPVKNRATQIDFETGRDIVAACDMMEGDSRFLRSMIAFYGPRSGAVLRMMSHEEGAPWDTVRRDGGSPGMTIPDHLILSYFSSQLNGRKGSSAH